MAKNDLWYSSGTAAEHLHHSILTYLYMIDYEPFLLYSNTNITTVYKTTAILSLICFCNSPPVKIWMNHCLNWNLWLMVYYSVLYYNLSSVIIGSGAMTFFTYYLIVQWCSTYIDAVTSFKRKTEFCRLSLFNCSQLVSLSLQKSIPFCESAKQITRQQLHNGNISTGSYVHWH